MAHDLVLLTECGDGLEAASVRSVLESEGISCVVQGEHHAQLLGGTTMPTLIAQRVLVKGADLERAMTLLEANARVREAVCAVHEQVGTRDCPQCGAVMCGACAGCESCAMTPRNRWAWVPALALPILVLVAVLWIIENLGITPD